MWPLLEIYARSSDDVSANLRKIFDNPEKCEEYRALFQFMAFILEQFNTINKKTQV
jgi:hypothetical protein